MSVVASHLAHMVNSPARFPLMRCGICAVPVFFILSGFVMSKISSGGQHGPGPAFGFLGKRILRIFPAYWLYLALTLLLIYFGGNTWDGAAAGKDWAASWSLLTLRPATPLAITAGWSLIYEMIFYYVLFLFWLNRTLGLVALTLYFAWSMVLEHVAHVAICGFYPLDGLFLSGLLLGILDRRRPDVLARLFPLLFVGLALILTYIITGVDYRGWLFYGAAIPMVTGILALERSYAPQITGWLQATMQFLGTVSFSLYVGHTLVQSVLIYLVGAPTLITAPLFILGPILIATVSFVLVERPAIRLSKWLDSKLARGAAPSAVESTIRL